MAGRDIGIDRSDMPLRHQTRLPSISDLLGDNSSRRFLPPPSLGFSSMLPYPSRSHSYPTLPVDQLSSRLDEHHGPWRGWEMLPTTPVLPTGHHLPSPPLTVTGPSSDYSVDTITDTDLDVHVLEKLVEQAEPDVAAVVQSATTLLDDSQMGPAHGQGWFQPNPLLNEYSARLEKKLGVKGLDELVEAFFYRDESRALYGERVVIPRKVAKTSPAPKDLEQTEQQPDSMPLEKPKSEEDGNKRHQKQEGDRRDRHRDLQHDSHQRCPEIAAECGAEHAKELKQTRTQAGKGPGKDEQLCTAIYAHEMAGRVVQALDERRRRAEYVAQLLVKLLQRQGHSTSGEPREMRCYSHRPLHRKPVSRPDYVGVKRSPEDMEDSRERAWKRFRAQSD